MASAKQGSVSTADSSPLATGLPFFASGLRSAVQLATILLRICGLPEEADQPCVYTYVYISPPGKGAKTSFHWTLSIVGDDPKELKNHCSENAAKNESTRLPQRAENAHHGW